MFCGAERRLPTDRGEPFGDSLFLLVGIDAGIAGFNELEGNLRRVGVLVVFY